MIRTLGISALAIISSLNVVSAECYGPDACLRGWVWREATSTDHVCVTPKVRTETSRDNSAAATRVDNLGPNTDSCLNGYVWREAFAGDHVCVRPDVRAQAQVDNDQAKNRIALLNIWVSDSKSSLDSYPTITVNGDHFNSGSVRLAIFDDSNRLVQDWTTITVTSNSGYTGASWGWKSMISDCTRMSSSRTGFAVAQDVESSCYSNKIPVQLC
jgi:hypothetical protein